MRCDNFLPLIEKLADGEATSAEQQRAEAHLENCTSCQSHFRFLQALPAAARQASLTDPPDMYWDVLPRKIMSRIERERDKGRRGWFGRLLAPSWLRWAGALAATLVAAVVGLRVLEFPMADRNAPSSASVTRSNEEERGAGISRRDAPASAMPAMPAGPAGPVAENVMDEKPAAESAGSLTSVRRQAPAEPAEPVQEVVALNDESFEQASRKRVAREPAPPVAREEFATGALSMPGKAGQKKQDEAGEATDRPVIGGRRGRLEQDLDELKPTQLNEKNRDKVRARSTMPDETANVPDAKDQEGQEPKPAGAEPPSDQDPAAQSVSVSRSLRAPPPLEGVPATAAQAYRDLVARYPIRDEAPVSSDLSGSTGSTGSTGPAGLSGIAKEKEGAFSDTELATECADWRQFLARYPQDERVVDARYRLALCSIEIFERSPSDDNRRRAVEDGTSYLDVATDEKHAEPIRRVLERIRP